MSLKRALSLSLLFFYGVGTIIGAGVYALIGEVVKTAQTFTPVAFIIASVIALFTAASYAELSSRFPMSAGSALYVRKAFNSKWLSACIGWLIVLTGIVSAATISHGFVNYFQLLIPLPSFLIIFFLIITLGGINIWGITESARTIMVMTIIEITGLLIVIYYGKNSFTQLAHIDYLGFLEAPNWSGILIGSFIAFYAFIGFEDMVNVAEETKNPERTLPRAILLALVGASLIYVLVAFVVVYSIPSDQLLTSSLPLAYVIQSQGHSPLIFIGIALIATMNGILVQIIMASRLIYGMAKMQNAPKIFSSIYHKTQTPVFSSLLVLLAILVFSFWLPIDTLAKITTTMMLFLFSMMHLSLIVVKFKDKKIKPAFSVPLIFPIIGVITTIGFLLSQLLINVISL